MVDVKIPPAIIASYYAVSVLKLCVYFDVIWFNLLIFFQILWITTSKHRFFKTEIAFHRSASSNREQVKLQLLVSYLRIIFCSSLIIFNKYDSSGETPKIIIKIFSRSIFLLLQKSIDLKNKIFKQYYWGQNFYRWHILMTLNPYT